jgi:hypothetical protein
VHFGGDIGTDLGAFGFGTEQVNNSAELMPEDKRNPKEMRKAWVPIVDMDVRPTNPCGENLDPSLTFGRLWDNQVFSEPPFPNVIDLDPFHSEFSFPDPD